MHYLFVSKIQVNESETVINEKFFTENCIQFSSICNANESMYGKFLAIKTAAANGQAREDQIILILRESFLKIPTSLIDERVTFSDIRDAKSFASSQYTVGGGIMNCTTKLLKFIIDIAHMKTTLEEKIVLESERVLLQQALLKCNLFIHLHPEELEEIKAKGRKLTYA